MFWDSRFSNNIPELNMVDTISLANTIDSEMDIDLFLVFFLLSNMHQHQLYPTPRELARSNYEKKTVKMFSSYWFNTQADNLYWLA